MPRASDAIVALNDLADSHMVLELKWEWRDGRRGLVDRLLNRSTIQRHEKSYEMAEFRDDVYGGQALIDRDPLEALPRIHDDLRSIAQHLSQMRRDK